MDLLAGLGICWFIGVLVHAGALGEGWGCAGLLVCQVKYLYCCTGFLVSGINSVFFPWLYLFF